MMEADAAGEGLGVGGRPGLPGLDWGRWEPGSELGSL